MTWESAKPKDNWGVNFFMSGGREVYLGNMTRAEALALAAKAHDTRVFEVEEKYALSAWDNGRESTVYFINPAHITYVQVKQYNF